MFTFLEWVSVTLGIVGSILVAYQKIWGFHVWVITNALIISLALHDGRMGIALLFVVYTITSLIGIWQWQKKSERIKKITGLPGPIFKTRKQYLKDQLRRFQEKGDDAAVHAIRLELFMIENMVKEK